MPGRVRTRRRQLEVARPLGRTRSGSWTRMPAPSPVSGSAPAAPRWFEVAERGEGLLDACAWLRRPCMSTTKPTPQASCSKRGS